MCLWTIRRIALTLRVWHGRETSSNPLVLHLKHRDKTVTLRKKFGRNPWHYVKTLGMFSWHYVTLRDIIRTVFQKNTPTLEPWIYFGTGLSIAGLSAYSKTNIFFRSTKLSRKFLDAGWKFLTARWQLFSRFWSYFHQYRHIWKISFEPCYKPIDDGFPFWFFIIASTLRLVNPFRLWKFLVCLLALEHSNMTRVRRKKTTYYAADRVPELVDFLRS